MPEPFFNLALGKRLLLPRSQPPDHFQTYYLLSGITLFRTSEDLVSGLALQAAVVLTCTSSRARRAVHSSGPAANNDIESSRSVALGSKNETLSPEPCNANTVQTDSHLLMEEGFGVTKKGIVRMIYLAFRS